MEALVRFARLSGSSSYRAVMSEFGLTGRIEKAAATQFSLRCLATTIDAAVKRITFASMATAPSVQRDQLGPSPGVN